LSSDRQPDIVEPRIHRGIAAGLNWFASFVTHATWGAVVALTADPAQLHGFEYGHLGAILAAVSGGLVSVVTAAAFTLGLFTIPRLDPRCTGRLTLVAIIAGGATAIGLQTVVEASTSGWPILLTLGIMTLLNAASVHAAFRVGYLYRSLQLGVCPSCGYDLRGLKDGRCPECGRPSN
jgi:hypothetical protein